MIIKITGAFGDGMIWIAAHRIVQVTAVPDDTLKRWPNARSAIWCIGDADDTYTIATETPEQVVDAWRAALLESGVLLYGPRGTEIRGS